MLSGVDQFLNECFCGRSRQFVIRLMLKGTVGVLSPPSSCLFLASLFHVLAGWSWDARRGSEWRRRGDQASEWKDPDIREFSASPHSRPCEKQQVILLCWTRDITSCSADMFHVIFILIKRVFTVQRLIINKWNKLVLSTLETVWADFFSHTENLQELIKNQIDKQNW